MVLRANLDTGEDLNMTPMIDIVFNLLIFFLLSSTVLREEQQMELQLPQVGSSGPLTAAPDQIVIHIHEDGSTRIGEETLDGESLRRRLAAARQNYPDQAVVLRGDADTRYQNVAAVLSLCREAKITYIDVRVQEP